MFKNCWSQYILIFQAEHKLYETTENRVFTIELPRCGPDNLMLRESINENKKRFGTNFRVALLVQIEITDKVNENNQFHEIKEYFKYMLSEHWISPMNQGMWFLPTELMYECVLNLLEGDQYEVVSYWGDWKDEIIEDLN